MKHIHTVNPPVFQAMRLGTLTFAVEGKGCTIQKGDSIEIHYYDGNFAREHPQMSEKMVRELFDREQTPLPFEAGFICHLMSGDVVVSLLPDQD